MSPPEKVHPVAYALAAAVAVVLCLAVAAIFQVCWNYGGAQAFGGGQINYGQAFCTLGAFIVAGYIVSLAGVPRKP